MNLSGVQRLPSFLSLASEWIILHLQDTESHKRSNVWDRKRGRKRGGKRVPAL